MKFKWVEVDQIFGKEENPTRFDTGENPTSIGKYKVLQELAMENLTSVNKWKVKQELTCEKFNNEFARQKFNKCW